MNTFAYLFAAISSKCFYFCHLYFLSQAIVIFTVSIRFLPPNSIACSFYSSITLFLSYSFLPCCIFVLLPLFCFLSLPAVIGTFFFIFFHSFPAFNFQQLCVILIHHFRFILLAFPLVHFRPPPANTAFSVVASSWCSRKIDHSGR